MRKSVLTVDKILLWLPPAASEEEEEEQICTLWRQVDFLRVRIPQSWQSIHLGHCLRSLFVAIIFWVAQNQ
jgi:hypothetical protein